MQWDFAMLGTGYFVLQRVAVCRSVLQRVAEAAQVNVP